MLAIVLPQWLMLIDSVLKARSTVDTGGTLCPEESTATLYHLTEPGQIFNSQTSSFEHFLLLISVFSFFWRYFLSRSPQQQRHEKHSFLVFRRVKKHDRDEKSTKFSNSNLETKIETKKEQKKDNFVEKICHYCGRNEPCPFKVK